jgi:hypothetical protein
MTSSDISGTTIFNTVTKKFTFQDTTDYAGLTVPVTPVYGLMTATGPSAQAFLTSQNPSSPFLDTGASEFLSAAYALPLTSGAIQVGAYSFAYTSRVTYAVAGLDIEQFYTGAIVVNGDYTFIVSGDTVTVSSATTPGNNGVKNVTGSTYVEELDQTFIAVSQILTLEAGGSAVLAYSATKNYTKTFSYDYTTCTQVTAGITSSYSCETNGTLTAYDSTTYGDHAISARTMRVDYPAGLKNPTPNPTYKTNTSTSGTAPVTIAPLSTGTYQATLETTVQATQDDDLIVQYAISTADTITATCSTGLCDVDACVERISTQYRTDIAQTGQSSLTTTMIQLGVLYGQYLVAKNCSNTTAAATASAAIQDLIGDECTCSETDSDVPEWIGDPYGGTMPNYQFNSFVPVYSNKTGFTNADTAEDALAESVSILQEISSNAGDVVVVNMRGSASGGNGNLRVRNTTVGLNYTSITINDTDSFDLTLRIYREDGDGIEWSLVIYIIDGGTGATTVIHGGASDDDYWSYEATNILDISPQANILLEAATVHVERNTNYSEAL